MSDREDHDARRPLTEAEYLAWVRQHMQAETGRLNERYGDLLPEGVRFEWVPLDALAE